MKNYAGKVCVIYARESSKDETKSPPIERQIKIGREWCQESKVNLLRIYSDKKSGGDWNREDFNALIKGAKQRKFGMVWVWSHDRLARDVEQFMRFFRIMRECNVKVFDMVKNRIVDMQGVDERFTNIIESAVSEKYRLDISRKVKRIYQHRKQLADKQGKSIRWGRATIPIKIQEQVIKIKKENPKLGARKIRELLSTYSLKLREGEKTPRQRKPSVAWVKQILKKNKTAKNTPTQNKDSATRWTVEKKNRG